MYSVKIRPEKHRVEVSFEEAFDFEQDEFVEELIQAISQVRRQDSSFDLLSDFSTVPVMDQNSANDSKAIVDWCAANGLRKSANVMGTVIQKLQVQRLSEHDHRFGYFQTAHEAERWLEEGWD